MYNCIFTSHCTEYFCDKSCPTLAETSYLLERNNISMDSDVFKASDADVNKMFKILSKCAGKVGAHVVRNGETLKDAELLTYCAICQNWQGSRLHCNVYNLKFSKYIEDVKKSWGMKAEPEELQYMTIWARTAKVLIISNLDYVNFGEFESQTLLNLLQGRASDKLTTIFVIPPVNLLVSTKSSVFFNNLKNQLNEAVKVVAK